MPALEELLYQALTGDTTLAGLLATYGGKPAAFELLAPPDTDPGWGPEQTPRVEYTVARREDPERRVSGQVGVTVLDAGDSMAAVAAIEARLRALLDGATFRPDEGTVSLHWARADLFDQDPAYRGVELVFDLIAWPGGLTFAPDPVQALRIWAVAKWSALQVDPAVWLPTDASPALYWRLAAVEGVEMTSWGAWVTGRFHGHVLAPTPAVRLEWTRRIAEQLAISRRCPLGDGSSLYFQVASANSDADYVRQGQIRLTARFGVLDPAVLDPTLAQAVVGGAVTGGGEVIG